MSDCRDKEIQIGCFTPSDGEVPVKINHTIIYDNDGIPIATYFSDREGVVIDETTYLGGGVASIGDCKEPQVDCVESQEWTYGIDNTGTRWDDVAEYELTLSDGSTLAWSQDGSAPNWSGQLTEWAANIQTAADNAGLVWFVEPRFIDNYNPTNIDGTINGPGGTPSGLPGAPTEIIGQELAAGGMAWRYVNFQVCPGQPVPVSARRLTSTLYGNDPYDLTAAGPILGVVQKFYVCRDCGDEPVWYLEDNTTLADAGQIPNCYLPCGFLSLQPDPPNKECEYAFDTGCDNTGSDDPNLFTDLITRRVTYCNGAKVAVEYYEEDSADPTSLEPYTLVGEFVDCASGIPVDLPPPPCETSTYVGLLYRLNDDAEVGSNIDYWGPTASYGGTGSAAPHGNVSDIFDASTGTLVHPNGAPNASYVSPTFNTGATSSAAFLNAVGLATSQDTSGTDQLRLRGYIVLNTPGLLKDTNTNTGERGGIWINRCCAGDLELYQERTTDTAGGNTGVFDGVRVPAGIHYIEAATSDLSLWQGLQLSVSYDDGATYEPFTTYLTKPSYECFPVLRCNDSSALIRGDVPEIEVVTIGEFDSWCPPPYCEIEGEEAAGGTSATASDIGAEVEAADTYKGPTAQEIWEAQRDGVEGRVRKYQSNAIQSLPVAAGQRGNLISISDTGAGLVYFTLDGSPPSDTVGDQRGEVSGQYLAAPIRNIDLSQVRFDGSSTTADYTVFYEVFL